MQVLLKYFKENRSFFSYVVLRLLIVFLGLAANVVVVRKLSISDYGIFSVVFMIVGLITTFGFSWSSSTIVYFGAKEKEISGSINKTFWSRNIIIFVSLTVVTVLFVVFKTQIDKYIGISYSYLLLFWLYVSIAEDYLLQYFLAVNKQLLSGFLSLTAKLIYLLMVLVFSFDLYTILLINIVSHLSVVVYVLRINKSDIGKFTFDKDWFKEVLNFSLWQLFGYAGVYLINFGDTAVIKQFLTIEDVGLYNVAFKLFSVIEGFAFFITGFFASTITKAYIQKDSRKLKKFFYRDRYIVFFVSLFAHLIVILFAKQIFIILYGDRYLESVSVFRILMIGSIVRYLAVFYTLYYNVSKKYKVLQILNIVRAVLNIVVDIVLIQFFGIIGVAIATTTVLIATFIFSAIYLEKSIKIDSYCEN